MIKPWMESDTWASIDVARAYLREQGIRNGTIQPVNDAERRIAKPHEQALFERGWTFAEIARHLKSTPMEVAIRIGRGVDFLFGRTINGGSSR
jgi:hypothetical protein